MLGIVGSKKNGNAIKRLRIRKELKKVDRPIDVATWLRQLVRLSHRLVASFLINSAPFCIVLLLEIAHLSVPDF